MGPQAAAFIPPQIRGRGPGVPDGPRPPTIMLIPNLPRKSVFEASSWDSPVEQVQRSQLAETLVAGPNPPKPEHSRGA